MLPAELIICTQTVFAAEGGDNVVKAAKPRAGMRVALPFPEALVLPFLARQRLKTSSRCAPKMLLAGRRGAPRSPGANQRTPRRCKHSSLRLLRASERYQHAAPRRKANR
jgi:hypothetical protein